MLLRMHGERRARAGWPQPPFETAGRLQLQPALLLANWAYQGHTHACKGGLQEGRGAKEAGGTSNPLTCFSLAPRTAPISGSCVLSTEKVAAREGSLVARGVGACKAGSSAGAPLHASFSPPIGAITLAGASGAPSGARSWSEVSIMFEAWGTTASVGMAAVECGERAGKGGGANEAWERKAGAPNFGGQRARPVRPRMPLVRCLHAYNRGGRAGAGPAEVGVSGRPTQWGPSLPLALQ